MKALEVRLVLILVVLQIAKFSGGELTEKLMNHCLAKDTPLDLYSCYDDQRQGRIHTGKSCLAKDTTNNKTYVASCVDGRWLVTSQVDSQSRQKRSMKDVLGGVNRTLSDGTKTIARTTCLFVCDGGNVGDTEPTALPNTPPIVTCPDVDDVIAANGTSAVVSWNTTLACDQEDGELNVTLEFGQDSGSRFQRGSHTVIYSATDNEGLNGFCTITFEVKVETCSQPELIENGYAQCGEEIVAGSKCQYYCFDGYELTDNYSTLICNQDGMYDHQPPSCRPIQCANSTSLHPQHGSYDCSQQFQYQSTCTTKCNEGYALQVPSLIICQANKEWSGGLADCIDNQPPVFENCPDYVKIYTGPGTNTAIANWTTPTATDNDGKTVTVLQTQGVKLGSAVGKGSHEISYKATDTYGNTSPECTFFLHVEQMTCGSPWPVFNGEFLNIKCTDGSGYGSTCKLSCKGSYPLIGNNTITCLMNNTGDKPEGVWYWGDADKPYCKQNPCPRLTPPQNGALSCGKWLFGTQCAMQCNDQFDLPLVGAHGPIGSFSGLFTCSTSSGKWSPTSDVPGCIGKRNPSRSRLPAEIFYYSGSCNNLTTQSQIKQNFIQKMNELQKLPGWQGVCPNTEQCNVENVEVTCGSTSRKRRRQYRLRRNSNNKKIKLSFSITYDWGTEIGYSSAELYAEIDEKMKQLGQLIRSEVEIGTFDVIGTNIDRNSIVYEESYIDCEKGQYPRYATLTCGSCPPGTFLNATSRDCKQCEKGTFKSDVYGEACTKCPQDTTTIELGSKSISDCIAFCKPGYFSFNGLKPCTPCSLSEYQPSWMSTKCIKCPPLLTTRLTASISLGNCTAADDNCNPNPCNENKCINTGDSYECFCSGGYSGKNCKDPPDYCKYISCQNEGSCINTKSGFTCNCQSGFKGKLCNVQIVNGNWNQWEEWSVCSVSCGGGIKKRIRLCNDPPPDKDGKTCIGERVQTGNCEITACPSCEFFKNSSGLIIACNTTGESIQCFVKCVDGMIFTPGFTPLDVYRCSKDTNYQWNGQRPTCSRVYSPSSFKGIASITYLDFPCTATNEAKRQLIENSKLLPCVQHNTCKIIIRIPGCGTRDNRKKRSISDGKVFFELQSPLQEGDDLDINSYINGGTVSNPKFQLSGALNDLETSLQLLNKSSDIFKLNIGNEIQPVTKKIAANAICPSGQVRIEAFCVECPQGSDSKQYISCTSATYHKKKGRTFCKKHSAGYPATVQQSTNASMSTYWIVAIIVVQAAVLIIIVFIIVRLHSWKRYLKVHNCKENCNEQTKSTFFTTIRDDNDESTL